MARRYVGVCAVEGNDIALEVRAAKEREAKAQMLNLIDTAYPNATWRDNSPEVSRLKEKQGKWSPVKTAVIERLKRATTWVTPRDVEATDLHVPEGTNIIPFTPPAAVKPKVTPKTTIAAAPRFNFTEEVLKAMAHDVRRYGNNNEVIK